MASLNVVTPAQPTVSQIDRALAQIQQADRLMNQKQHDLAAPLLESIKASFPELPEVNYLLAQAYQKQGLLRSAMLAALQEYLDHPNDARVSALLRTLASERLFHVVEANFSGKSAPVNCPSISLFMIVRNEERNLPHCLDSVKDIVQEMVIVDTGSTDRTVEIARSYGAQVFVFEWRDDFAAARNEALKHTTCDWLLMMDADNWLEPKDRIHIQEAAASGQADAYLCKQVTWKGDRIYTKDNQFRLFRNHLGLVYTGVLHEYLDIDKASRDVISANCNIEIQHITFLDCVDLHQKKRKRNRRVIEQALVKEPDNLRYRIIHVCMLDQDGESKEAASEFKKINKDLPQRYQIDLYLQLAYLPLLKQYYESGDTESLRQMILAFMADGYDTFWVWCLSGNMYLNVVNNPQRALIICDRLSKMKVTDRDISTLQSKDPQTELFFLRLRSLLYTGQLDGARTLLKAKKKNGLGQKIKAAMEQAGQMVSSQEYRPAYDLLAPLLYQDARVARLAAEAAGGFGDTRMAAEAEAVALLLECAPAPADWIRLARSEAKNNCVELSIRACQMGLATYPMSQDLLLLCAQSALKRSDPSLSIDCYVRLKLLEPQNQAVREGLQFIAERLGLQPLALIRNQAVSWVKTKAFVLARSAMVMVVDADPADQQANQMLAMLEKVC